MSDSEARLLGIAVRPEQGAPPEERNEATIRVESGLEGDHRRSVGSRQVTVLTRSGWEAACAEAGAMLPWTARRANLLVDGLTLTETRGARLIIGGVELEITGETTPCHVMEATHPGLRIALGPDWRGGVTCRVITGGDIRVGDPVVMAKHETAA